MHVALIALLGCSTPDPYAPIEAELGESIAPEDRAGLPARGAYVLVLPDRLVVGSVGWDAAGLELEPEVRERLVKVATLPLASRPAKAP